MAKFASRQSPAVVYMARARARNAPRCSSEELKKVVRKYLAMRVRRCVLGPTTEHPRRQVEALHLAPKIAAFLV